MENRGFVCPSVHPFTLLCTNQQNLNTLGEERNVPSIKQRQENLQSVEQRSWCASHVHDGRLFSYQRQTMCVTVSTYISPSTDTLYWKMNMKKRRAKLSCLDWLTDSISTTALMHCLPEWVSEWVGFNVPVNTLHVILETSCSSQSLALVLTT